MIFNFGPTFVGKSFTDRSRSLSMRTTKLSSMPMCECVGGHVSWKVGMFVRIKVTIIDDCL